MAKLDFCSRPKVIGIKAQLRGLGLCEDSAVCMKSSSGILGFLNLLLYCFPFPFSLSLMVLCF